MFAAWCEKEQTEVLLSERRIRSIEADGDAVTVRFTCWCGHEGHFTDLRFGAPRHAHLDNGPVEDTLV